MTLDGGYASILSAITSASWQSLAAVVYLGFFATILGYAVWGSLLARYSAAAVAPFALLVPCVGAITAHLIFGEVFEPLRLSGMAMMLIGLLITIVPLNR
jgi:O-acetylserine/cysteine efflux transporter